MLNDETIDKLNKTVAVCNRHKTYLTFAKQQTSELFPITSDKYDYLTQIQVSFLDQMIYRFSKLQDNIGNRLFKTLLDYLGEEPETMAFKDILLRLEKLRILPSANEWLELREIRNLVSHEYPEDKDKLIAGLNLLHIQTSRLITIYNGLLNYINDSISFKV